MTANITGLAIYEGLATSLDTLCAQAYGSGKKTMVGLHLQRMILFMLAVTIPIGAIWLCSGWILAALVPEKAIAHLAGYYLSLLLAGAPGYAIFEAGKRFTQAQGLFNASLFVLLIATPINIALNYIFVFVLDWDLTGAALATVISNNLLPLLLWIYVYFVNPSSLECWGGFTKDAFTHWGPMAKLAIPGIVMVETEWLAFVSFTHCMLGYGAHANHLVGHSYLLHKLSFHSSLSSAVNRHDSSSSHLPRPLLRRRSRLNPPGQPNRRWLPLRRPHRHKNVHTNLPRHRPNRLRLPNRLSKRPSQSLHQRPGSRQHSCHRTAPPRCFPIRGFHNRTRKRLAPRTG